MTEEHMYVFVNLSVMPWWLCMMVLPNWRVTQRITATPLIPMAYALLYTAFVVPSFGGEGADLTSLAGIRDAFARDVVVLLGWIHYVCFDLLVGMWVYRDARHHQLPWWGVAPCLVFNLMLGPFGFLCYIGFRAARLKRLRW